MKNNKKISAMVASLAILTSAAAYSANVVGNASATVATALTVTQTTPLSFGTFTSSANAGTINTSGTITGGVTYLSGAREGVFTITGSANTPVNSISGPTTLQLTSTPGGDTMSATLTYPATGTVTLDGNGSKNFNVSGELTVAANQPAGAYSNTYNVTVNY